MDYDIIGISYYPIWHGKSLTELELQLNNLSQTFEKEIVIAETAYPFTLDWNDWTTNIVGSENQIITPDFPANPTGQHDFILQINKLSTHNLERGIGFCYWVGDLCRGTETKPQTARRGKIRLFSISTTKRCRFWMRLRGNRIENPKNSGLKSIYQTN